ncbi:MAG: SDR family NAD(P)-dependent oxidoreductase [Woeseiaceae bacterium]|nr:SDR family NAD(P)-dependent oxidoreductase [Woeseiaceae bacterium]
MKNPLVLAIALLAATLTTACAVDTEPQKAVLVTGASSGIGRNIAEHLAAKGYFVYAGARKERDIAELNAIDNIQAVRLDVTIQNDIDAAVGTIRAGGKGLYGLVNNAGVLNLGPLTKVDEDDIDFLFDVNIYGVYRVTKAFAPMLIENQGRITTTGSISGFISGANGGVYSMSKFAMEAFTDSLAAELEPQGVEVSIVEPGSFKSGIMRTMAERSLKKAEAAGEEITAEQRRRAEGMIAAGESRPEPDAVAAAVEDALFSATPKRRYMVTPDEAQARVTLQHALRRIAELNHDHQFSYSRDELVNMLDEALEAL